MQPIDWCNIYIINKIKEKYSTLVLLINDEWCIAFVESLCYYRRQEVRICVTKKEKIEYELLNMLADTIVPVGSVTLSLLLKEQGLDVSGATVGRVLSEFDYKGYTAKYGYKGRMLTSPGQERYAELKNKQQLAEYSQKFYESVDAESRDNLIDVLIARRGIERETVRLAAIHATREDIGTLVHMYSVQKEDDAKGKRSHDSDVRIHQMIAQASKSQVLAAAYDFIWQNGKFSPVMEYIRTTVGSAMVVEHGRILEALIDKDPDEAEERMVAHIDNLISDVNKYWHLASLVGRQAQG